MPYSELYPSKNISKDMINGKTAQFSICTNNMVEAFTFIENILGVQMD